MSVAIQVIGIRRIAPTHKDILDAHVIKLTTSHLVVNFIPQHDMGCVRVGCLAWGNGSVYVIYSEPFPKFLYPFPQARQVKTQTRLGN